MLIDKSKMAVDSAFSFLNLRKQHTNLKLKLLLQVETHTILTKQNCPTKTSYDQPIQIVKDLTAIDQVQVATRHYRNRPGLDRPLCGYTSQPQIHKLCKTAYETNIKNHPLLEY